MSKHSWTFERVGGFDQARIRTGADLEAVPDLDQKLWVSLSCPVSGLELDERTLALIDTNSDGRVRAPELIAAIRWAVSLVTSADVLVAGTDGLALSSIQTGTDEGKTVLRTAKELLERAGKPDAKAITIADVEKALEAFEKQPFNGDSIVPASSASDEAIQKAIEDVLACTTPETDKSGQPGVTKATVEAFFSDVRAHVAWLEKADADAVISPLGAETAAACAAMLEVREKIDDYFTRQRLVAYDARALVAVKREEKDYLAIGAQLMSAASPELANLPIAQIDGAKPLPLEHGVNPAWVAKVAALRAKAVRPILGDRNVLTEVDWVALQAKLAPHESWLGTKAGASVEKLGAARVRALVSPEIEKAILSLVEQDAAKEPLAKAIEKVEKLVRLHRDLMTLVNNYVSFRDFYDRERDKAIFQSGRLYLDSRACDLVLKVGDAGKHATMAPLANTYLVYCDCTNAKAEKIAICAAVTAGDVDNLMVGRNGLFYDRKGNDWDATITKIIDNPISVRQAFWSPYKKLVRLIEEQVAKRADAAAAEADTKITSGVESTSAAAASGRAPSPPEPDKPKKIDIGVVAALGVAVGGITAALGIFLEAFLGMGFLMPLGLLGLMLAISGPSMAIAWLKLRKRNLGPILDANGWALNARAKVNVPLGTSLTSLARLPDGASRELTDPFAEKKRPWRLYLVLLVLVLLAGAWFVGKLDGWLPAKVRSTTLLGQHAPAYVEPTAPPAGETAAEP